MEIKNKTSRLVKPSTPTPSSLRNYNISFFDYPMPDTSVRFILYYLASQNDNHVNVFDRLETSLSKALTEFYPLAGRYMRHGSFIDCSDQGALYIQAKANFQLSKFLSLEWDSKLNLSHNLLPNSETGEAVVETDDPMLSVKVTTFECGGVAIGICISHKFSDMSSMCTFINNWAVRSHEIVDDELELRKYSPIFSFSHRFPKKAHISSRFTRSSTEMKHVMMQVFSFKGNEISKIREKLIFKDNIKHIRPSKVQLIVALLCKAFTGIDKENDEQPKMYGFSQAVNLRNKVVPKLPENSCGNFVTSANSRIQPSKINNIDLQGLLELLHDSINEIDNTCARLATAGDNEYEQLLDTFLEVFNQDQANNDIKYYVFSSWCKFPFYKFDFGWGKPIWRSIPNIAGNNVVILMDDQEGDGIEAWIHLDGKRISQLNQDPHIKANVI